MGILHSYQKFTLPALGPIVYNLGQILGAYVLGPIMVSWAWQLVPSLVLWVVFLCSCRRWPREPRFYQQ